MSAIGDHLSEMAILKTQNALGSDVNITPMTARMTFLFMLPFFLFGPFMGYLADRLNRRRLMLTADIVRMGFMLCFVSLTTYFAPLSTNWGPFIPLGLVGIFAALFSPARSALLPTLITTDQLVPANALIRCVGVMATVISVGLGGYIADHYTPQLAFKLDATTFALSALAVFFIVPPKIVHETKVAQPTVTEQLTGGFRYVFDHKRIRQIFFIGTVFWFSAATIRNVVPAIVKGAYQRTSYSDISMFLVLMVLGMVAGSLILTLLKDSLRSEIAITWSLIGAGLCSAGLAVSALLPIAPKLAHALGAVSIVGIGAFGSILIASYNALLQRIVPDRYRGRVYGVLDVCTISGLLLASGLLGIPNWPGLDKWAGVIVAGTALLLMASGFFGLVVRLRDTQGRIAYGFVRNFNEFICRFWYRSHRIGPCTVPRSGPVIITANHTCPADPLLICAWCTHRPISFMIAQEFSNIPVARYFVRLIECIPVRRDGQDAASVKKAMRKLNEGAALGIFIQGRIPKPDETVEPKDGVALLALRTGATVIPVHISGTRYTESVARGFFVRHRGEVRFGQPVDLSGFSGKPTREDTAKATATIFQAIKKLGEKNKKGE